MFRSESAELARCGPRHAGGGPGGRGIAPRGIAPIVALGDT